jgi:hypothetical protein
MVDRGCTCRQVCALLAVRVRKIELAITADPKIVATCRNQGVEVADPRVDKKHFLRSNRKSRKQVVVKSLSQSIDIL